MNYHYEQAVRADTAAHLGAAFRGRASLFRQQPKAAGGTITVVRDDAPDWVRDMVWDAHEAIAGRTLLLPVDWIYDAVAQAWDIVTDYGPEFSDDAIPEIASSMVDSHSDLMTWASEPWASALIDEAIEDHGLSADQGIGSLVSAGQFSAYERIVAVVGEYYTEKVLAPRN